MNSSENLTDGARSKSRLMAAMVNMMRGNTAIVPQWIKGTKKMEELKYYEKT